MILIFSNEYEYSTSNVMRWLKYYEADVIRINPDGNYKFVESSSEGLLFQNSITKQVYNLNDVTSCWWRRMGLGVLNFIPCKGSKLLDKNQKTLDPILYGKNSILNTELNALREYIFDYLYNNVSIKLGKPNPELNKLTILSLAKQYGLHTPKYRILTNLNQRDNNGLYISKAIGNGIYHTCNNKQYYSYTELLPKTNDENIHLFPSLEMECIEKAFEIRSFFIDGQFYSMAIFSQKNHQTKIDFRKYDEITPNRREPYKLPLDIEQKLAQLFQYLNLNTGSVDIIVDKKGTFYFLEINPVGQYAMVSSPCNYGLDKLIAKYLIHGKIM